MSKIIAMKLFFSLIAFFSYSTLFAQVKIEINGKTRINMDSLINVHQPSVNYSNKMPNALDGFKDNQQLIRNNQQGFDVYQSQVDNMKVLKPDTSNAAQLKMPTWNYKSETIYGEAYPVPEEVTCIGYASGKLIYKPKFRKLRPLQLNVLPSIK
jgi:hypothetical protein